MITHLKLINGDIVHLDVSPANIHNHFSNPQSCTDPILTQTNNNYYDQFVSTADKIVVDLGANIGLVSLHLSPYADKIISVEPTPSHFDLLEYFTKNTSSIHRLRGAASDKRGITTFYVREDSTENSLVGEKGGVGVNVETYTLQNIIDLYELPRIDFIKIDIEGSEMQFLCEENLQTLDRYVGKIFIEFHSVLGKTYEQHREYYDGVFLTRGWNTKKVGPDVLYCYKS